MIFVILFMLLIIAVFILLIYNRSNFKGESLDFAICLSILSFIIGALVCANIYKSKPLAIDVYRGKTELEITETTRDSTVVSRDSIVVFK